MTHHPGRQCGALPTFTRRAERARCRRYDRSTLMLMSARASNLPRSCREA